MSQQHIGKLVDSLVEQGCRLRTTKAGYFLYLPDGKTTIGLHKSRHSDMRTMRNLRAEVRRAGLEWPKGLPG